MNKIQNVKIIRGNVSCTVNDAICIIVAESVMIIDVMNKRKI